MSTVETIRTHGLAPVLLFLLLNLAVVLLRIAAVPFALAVLLLDAGANLAASALTPPAPGLAHHRRT